MSHPYKQVWFRASIPKAYHSMIKTMAEEKLGSRPFHSGKVGNGRGWTNNGKWMFKKGTFYFRSQEIASEFEQAVTFYEIQKPQHLQFDPNKMIQIKILKGRYYGPLSPYTIT